MGMYNKVWADCPECDAKCCMRIRQVVLGLGDFDLSNLDTFRNCSDKEILQVRECVLKSDFVCKNTDCSNRFNPLRPTVDKIEHVRNLLFGS